jgi:hypothetical protein
MLRMGLYVLHGDVKEQNRNGSLTVILSCFFLRCTLQLNSKRRSWERWETWERGEGQPKPPTIHHHIVTHVICGPVHVLWPFKLILATRFSIAISLQQ